LGRSLGAALVCVILAAARVAPAQLSAADSATAEALYAEALRLMEQKQYAEACPKLEESQRLDPGVGTLLYLGHCYEQVGKLASAWATFKDAAYSASNSGQKDREKVAQDRADAIKPNLAYMTLRVAEPDAPGLEVQRDGQTVGAAAWGVAVPIDPGEHRIEAQRPTAEPWSTVVNVPPGPGNIEVQVPPLAEVQLAPPAIPARAPLPPPQQRPVLPARPSQADSSPGGGQRTWGWAAISAGGAGLLVGGLFALAAKKADEEADKECRPDDRTLCSSDGVSLGDQAIARGNAATVATGLGAALLVTGGVLLWTAPSGDDKDRGRVSLSADFGPRFAGARFGGAW
jgi:serine/threonine-protein kinase